MTVLEAIQKSADFLQKKGVDSPRLQAELLLADVLKLARMKLYLQFERALSDAETDALRQRVIRRSQREPLQHIIGSTSFCGFEMEVNRNVLVPRPETELLAEAGWKFLFAKNGRCTALDFGTGSGCIAIALAAKCAQAEVWAIDVSSDALVIARRNAERNQVSNRIHFLQGTGFRAIEATASEVPPAQFDLIVSNPPYIPTAEIETLEPEVRDFDPRGALDGGTDGLDFYRKLAAEARPFLQPDGRLMLEFGDGQAPAIRDLFVSQKWIVDAVLPDYSQRERTLIARLH